MIKRYYIKNNNLKIGFNNIKRRWLNLILLKKKLNK